MPEARDPWNLRYRPRSSMKPFTGAPWKTPTLLDHKAENEGPRKPADWFIRYQRMNGADVSKHLSGKHYSDEKDSKYEPCDLNPGVAYNKRTQKWTLLLFTNGVATEKGRFFTESEGLQAYPGYHDMQSRGPQGVAGVPLSRGNEGPPGAVILPDGRKNYPPKTEADRVVRPDVRFWKNNEGRRPRPTTALLRNKGQWNGSAPDHGKTSARDDLALVYRPLEER